MDRDYIKQTPGPQQGNIHQDSDEGRNTDEHAGSTINKATEQVFWNHDEHIVEQSDAENAERQKDKDETIGIP